MNSQILAGRYPDTDEEVLREIILEMKEEEAEELYDNGLETMVQYLVGVIGENEVTRILEEVSGHK